MAEIETAPGPAEKPPVIETKSVHSSNDEKASPSHEHEHKHEHKDDKSAPETEELSDAYDPNVYAGASCLIPTPR